MGYFPFAPPAAPLALGLQASTGPAGVALQDATPSILSWTAPNDGKLHRAALFAVISVTALETGGQVSFSLSIPGGAASGRVIFPSGLAAASVNYPLDDLCPTEFLLAPGTTFSITQTAALTAGAATVWAEIWGA